MQSARNCNVCHPMMCDVRTCTFMCTCLVPLIYGCTCGLAIKSLTSYSIQKLHDKKGNFTSISYRKIILEKM